MQDIVTVVSFDDLPDQFMPYNIGFVKMDS